MTTGGTIGYKLLVVLPQDDVDINIARCENREGGKGIKGGRKREREMKRTRREGRREGRKDRGRGR